MLCASLWMRNPHPLSVWQWTLVLARCSPPTPPPPTHTHQHVMRKSCLAIGHTGLVCSSHPVGATEAPTKLLLHVTPLSTHTCQFALAYQSVCALHIVMAFFQPVCLPFLVIYAFTHPSYLAPPSPRPCPQAYLLITKQDQPPEGEPKFNTEPSLILAAWLAYKAAQEALLAAPVPDLVQVSVCKQ